MIYPSVNYIRFKSILNGKEMKNFPQDDDEIH